MRRLTTLRKAIVIALALGGSMTLAGCSNGGSGSSAVGLRVGVSCSAGTVPTGSVKNYRIPGLDESIKVKGRQCFDLVETAFLGTTPPESPTVGPTFCGKVASEPDLNAVLGHGLLTANDDPGLDGNTSPTIVFEGMCEWQANYLATPQPTPTPQTLGSVTLAKGVVVDYLYDSARLSAAYSGTQQLIASDSHVTARQVKGVGVAATLFTNSDTQLAGRDLLTTDEKGVTISVHTNTTMTDSHLESMARQALVVVEKAERT